jgi:hypothetical protein
MPYVNFVPTMHFVSNHANVLLKTFKPCTSCVHKIIVMQSDGFVPHCKLFTNLCDTTKTIKNVTTCEARNDESKCGADGRFYRFYNRNDYL